MKNLLSERYREMKMVVIVTGGIVMRLFLCGGGSGEQTSEAIQRLNEIINNNKPILYVPLAMDEVKHPYEDCFEWIKDELKSVSVPYIEMVRTFQELESKNYYEYSALFIGGGNTFKLLKGLKETRCFEKIKEYIDNDGIVFGGSAGAIIFGEDINTCRFADKNEVGLLDTKGFNVLNGISLLCHYTNQNAERTKINTDYLTGLSKDRKIIALPEEDTMFINGKSIEIIGTRPYYEFENGIRIRRLPYKEESDEIRLPGHR